MQVDVQYASRSGFVQAPGSSRLGLSPNLSREAVSFAATLNTPVQFREAISALHDIVISDLNFAPRDRTQYEEWKAGQRVQENRIRSAAVSAHQTHSGKPSAELRREYKRALSKYRGGRRTLDKRLRAQNRQLWRKLMPYDPIINVADDVVTFECFSSDESSYGCLSVDRAEAFSSIDDVQLGTTNVDYSWDLYNAFQRLRSYRETRFEVQPEGFDVRTSGGEAHYEEKIDLPDGWLQGFMQLQSAMCLPMRRVELSVDAVYSLLAYLRRHREKTGPRAVRFDLFDGERPQMVLEPWETAIESSGPIYRGPTDEPVRIWGRRRLMTLARVLPLAHSVDVYLLGTGLPSFWVVKMEGMRLTLGLSGWTQNDWTRGSAIDMLLPKHTVAKADLAAIADYLATRRQASLGDIAATLPARSVACDSTSTAALCLNQLALRGQVIHDLEAGVFRWRQVLPVALSENALGEQHPERAAAEQILASRDFKLGEMQPGPRGGIVITGQVANKPCEVLLDADGGIRKGKCLCDWHYKYGIRNGPCCHIQVLRDVYWHQPSSDTGDWYASRLRWAAQ